MIYTSNPVYYYYHHHRFPPNINIRATKFDSSFPILIKEEIFHRKETSRYFFLKLSEGMLLGEKSVEIFLLTRRGKFV